MALLEVKGVSAGYEKELVIEDVTINLNKGEIVGILGLSGSGKTTLFNVISGLLKPDCGEVLLNGEDITAKTGKVSYMLQKDLLLPYKTIMSNVILPMTIKGKSRKEAKRLAAPLFKEFGLEGTQKMYPALLSGGMRQRAAFLRTYLYNCPVALLDEPFSALDALTKASIHEWYVNIMREIDLSVLFITHDIDEAIKLSDRIYILGDKPGKIIKEVIIKPEDVRKKDLLLSDGFLAYKREIMSAISLVSAKDE